MVARTEKKTNEETGEEQEVEVDYPFRQPVEPIPEGTAVAPLVLDTKNGACPIADLKYEQTETFDEGAYVVTITDVTQSQSPLPEIKIALIISG